MTEANVAELSAEESFRAEALRWIPNVARYARLLTRNQDDAEDLAQETYLRAFQNWATFRLGTDCRKWLFTICRNVFLRSRERHTGVPLSISARWSLTRSTRTTRRRSARSCCECSQSR